MADSTPDIDLTDASRLARVAGVVEAEVDGERILLSPKDFSYFGLTGAGAPVWDKLRDERSLGEVIAELTSEFDADDAVIIKETREFVEALAAAGLISVS